MTEEKLNAAKAFLKQVELIDTHINNKLEELSRLKDMVYKITSTLKADVVSGSGNQDKLGDGVARIIDLEAEINRTVDDFVDKKKMVSAIIDQIQDPDQLQVIHKRYIEHLTWEEIACQMHMTYRNVCYIHGRALQTVEALLTKAL